MPKLDLFLKNKYGLLICTVIFTLGVLTSYHLAEGSVTKIDLSNDSALTQTSDSLRFIEVFWKIFKNNLIVGLMLAVIGYLSGSVMTILILFWNGILVGTLLSGVELNENLIPYFAFHGPIELMGFFLFSLVGLKGIKFYQTLIREKKLEFGIQLKSLLTPSLLLCIAGVIEAYMICYY